MGIAGGCACGAIRFESTEAPVTTRYCWCRVCQYLGAGSGTVNAFFKAAGVTVKGTPSSHGFVADSGNVMHREFCGVCGTALFSRAEVRPHIVAVRVGALDDPEIAPPELTIWTAEAPGWACISERIPQLEGQAPPAMT